MLQLPTVQGIIDRRILVNYRVDPDILAHILPQPFRPKLIGDYGMAGICLIRFRSVRPRHIPAFLGINSENAAHRIAVEWSEGGQTREGVFIPRRDSSSRFNTLTGGRLFPGIHHYAEFDVAESEGKFDVALESDDYEVRIAVKGRIATALPAGSVFASLDAASAFFERGSLGYSVTREVGIFDGLELRSQTWQVEPLAIEQVESSFFDDRRRFPASSIGFDCALLMRQIPHQWQAHKQLTTRAQYTRR
jgi:hypothetical protein